MDKEKLISYLQDVYQLEIEKRIVEKTIVKISNDFKEQKSDFAFSQKKHKVFSKRMPLFIFSVVFSLCVIIFCIWSEWFYFPDRFAYEENRIAEYSGNDLSEYDEFLRQGAIASLENEKKDLLLCKKIKNFMTIWLIGSCVGVAVLYKKLKDEQQEVNALSAVLGANAKKRMDIINENYAVLSTLQKDTVGRLKQLYSLNIVYPKYRYLEACGTFLEYLLSGRAHALEATAGFAGAYTLFEEELFRGEISNKLDQILQNQRVLIRGQKEILDKTDSIIAGIDRICRDCGEIKSGINKISRVQEVNTFYNSVMAYNTTVSRRIMEHYYY